MNRARTVASFAICLFGAANVFAGVGDPQVRTDHPWYPGELACSNFERLFATQAEVYRRVVGVEPKTDQEKSLASWLWRNTHFWHGEEGAQDLWGRGFTSGGDLATREYWTGLFAHGFGLCGTTHAQWVAELNALLGNNRARAVGTAGHVSFEALLQGGPYGDGKWAMLDHDLSTVIFDPKGESLLSIAEIARDYRRLTDRRHAPERQHGWLVCGLHPGDGGVYAERTTALYLSGYSGPPPIVHLRRGESMRRYLEPGLDDGKTFVFWGRNYNTQGVPGPERSRTWVNQPDKMRGSREGTSHRDGQARFANAVYTYEPDFRSGDYREGVIEESGERVVFEFYAPYIIAATPPNDKPWGIYDPGCRNGLVVEGRGGCGVFLSTDQGASWSDCGRLDGRLDLTDLAKGRRQYWLRLDAGAMKLADAALRITTVCQANASIIPRLTDGGCEVVFASSGQAILSAGPNLPQAQPHVVQGGFGTPNVTLEIASPRGEPATALYAAAHVLSSNPPDPAVEYFIDCSTDGGKSWKPILRDWKITRRGDEPKDFWSQSFCWGSAPLDQVNGPIQVRFHNTGRKSYARAEAHLTYRTAQSDRADVTFAWTDDTGDHEASHTFTGEPGREEAWRIETGRNVKTRWVEYRCASRLPRGT
jgi:hypothetical protein